MPTTVQTIVADKQHNNVSKPAVSGTIYVWESGKNVLL